LPYIEYYREITLFASRREKGLAKNAKLAIIQAMKTALVVDDSKIMRNIIKNTLTSLKMPCQFLEASDGSEALQLLLSQQIHIVLLDWNMPKLSGIDFLKKVRAMSIYKTLPIIMITSEAARYDVIEALKQGATDYIVKPVNERVFTEKVVKYMV
jgi:two-component system chemotaxis response regulator CheY